ncbi:MAG: hypothetical protein ACLQLC_08180 [Candidatus Sulfotelmatobacter sp.]
MPGGIAASSYNPLLAVDWAAATTAKVGSEAVHRIAELQTVLVNVALFGALSDQ